MHACTSRAFEWFAQVEPVTSGYRVTLTYELTAEKADMIRVGDNSGVQVLRKTALSKPLFAALKAALDDDTFMPDGKLTCVPVKPQTTVAQLSLC
jgi:hypothetical protein